ncbi:MAG: FCD domain-containing protein, partial [Alphaproteobacteria bacterium]
EAVLVLGIRRAVKNIDGKGNRDMLEAAFAAILANWERRDPSRFITALADYHRAINTISGNYFLDFFYRRPYINFFNRLLADLAPGGHWEQYLRNYKRIHRTLMEGDAHAAVASFVSHIQWVLDIMEGSEKKSG